MNSGTSIQVREMQVDDVVHIADYWLLSEPDYLTAMGVDLEKLPSRKNLVSMLTAQVALPYRDKASLAMIAVIDGIPSGHCNVNQIRYSESAHMHLHLWNKGQRRKGLGLSMVMASLPVFFQRLELQQIWCEPYRHNQAPIRVLEKTGFEFQRIYRTIPGSLNFEQEVNQYLLTRERFESIEKLKFPSNNVH